MAQHRTVDKTTFSEVGKWTKEKLDAKAGELTSSIENKVDKVEGSSLATSAQLTQIETNKTDIASLKTDKADASALENKVDKEEGKSLVADASITQIDTNKTNITTLQGEIKKFATTESLNEVIALVNKIGTFKSTTTKSTLATLKTDAKVGDTYIVTDDNNHWYVFCGTDQAGKNGIDANGFYDMGNHIDLSAYATVAALNNKVDKVSGKDLVATTDIKQITTNKTDIASLKTGKVDKVEGSSLATSAQLTQIETNKTSIGTLTTKVNAIESDLSELATALTEIV